MPSWAMGVMLPSLISLPTRPNDRSWKPLGSMSSPMS